MLTQSQRIARRTYGESAVQHTCKEAHAVVPAGTILKITPNEGVACVSLWHGSNNDDGDQTAENDQRHADILQM